MGIAPGHGRSDGLINYVPDFNRLVSDTAEYFDLLHAKFPRLRRFLYGESMGGAVALLVARARPSMYSGAVLSAPMVKIADEMKPPQFVVNTLVTLSHHFPTVAVTPVPVRAMLLIRTVGFALTKLLNLAERH